MGAASPGLAKNPAEQLSIWRENLAVFVGAVVVYLLLRSNDILGVDGAIRAFLVYQKPLTVELDTHMLYRVWMWLWMHGLAMLGYYPAGPLEHWRAAQTMNCVAAAGCVAILYDLLRRLTGSVPIAFLGALAWGAAHAVLLHATNSAEPMVGLLWSVAAFSLTLHGLWRRSYWLLALSGLSLALAMGTYRSMVFIGLACGLLALLWPASSRVGEPLRRALVLTGSFAVSLVVLFGTVAYMQHAPSVHEGVRMALAVDSRDVYLGLTFSKVANSLVGLVNAFVVAVPDDYAGVRRLISQHSGWLLWLAVCMMVVYVATWSLLQRGIRREALSLFIGCGASFLLGLILLWSWIPMYDKLWLQPLWLMVLMLAVAAKEARFGKVLAGMVVAVALVNVSVAVQAARGPWKNFEESQRVARAVDRDDLLIGGWSSVSIVYRHIWGANANNFDFPYHAGAKGPDAIAFLQQRISETKARGRHVYFLDILDQSEAEWNAFLGEHCGVPYGAMQVYRDQVREVARFNSDEKQVRLLELP